MSDITVIHNSAAGNAELATIKQAFAQQGAAPTYVPITSKKLGQVLRNAATKRNATVVAAGGDGTVNVVAGHLYGTAVNLGIIPVGTLNHFAKALHLPLKIPDAVKVILRGKHSRADVGIVNSHVFVNNSSLGFYPRSLLVRDEFDRHIGKWPAAVIGFLHAAVRPRHYRVDIVVDGAKHALRTPFVFIGNNPYKHAPPNIGERDTLTGGQLAVYVVKTTTSLATVRLLLRALFSRRHHAKDLAVYLTKSCTIYTRRHHSVHVACDGEVMTTETPLKYHSEHQALRVIVP